MSPRFLLMVLIACVAGGPAPTRGVETSVRVEVVDAEGGWPIPCRISIRGEDGVWHFPEATSDQGSAVPYRKQAIGRPDIVEMHTTLSAHPFVVRVPEGRYTLTAERGKEYHPERVQFSVGDKPSTVVVKLRRWIDMAARGWYSGDTHTHRTLGELPNVMLAEDLNIAFPLLDWVREAFVPPIDRRDTSFRDPGSATIRVDPGHLIVSRNTEYEIFTVAGTRHTLGAFFVINHKTPLELGVPPVTPVAERAHREGALIELDKHNWPWSMALVPVMPVDLFELANNHVWETEFGFRDPDTWGDPGEIEGFFTGEAVDQLEGDTAALTLGVDAGDTYEYVSEPEGELEVRVLTNENGSRIVQADVTFRALAEHTDGTYTTVISNATYFFVKDGDDWRIQSYRVERNEKAAEAPSPTAVATATGDA